MKSCDLSFIAVTPLGTSLDSNQEPFPEVADIDTQIQTDGADVAGEILSHLAMSHIHSDDEYESEEEDDPNDIQIYHSLLHPPVFDDGTSFWISLAIH